MQTATPIISLLFLPILATAEPMAYTTESGIELVPQATAFYENDDNVNRDENNPESTNIWGIEPSLVARIERNQYKANLSYKLKAGFSSDDKNDFVDHTFQIINFFEFNHRNHLVVDYQFRAQHETRGEDITEGNGNIIDSPIRFHRNVLNTNYIFGSKGAKGRLEFGIGYGDKTYRNYREGLTFAPNAKTKYNDFKAPRAHFEFYLRAAPSTYWLIGTRQVKTDYQHPNPAIPSRDSTTGFYYTGAQWELTGKTQGIARLGYQIKDFDNSGRETFRGFSWDIGLEWLPQEHTLITLNTTQAAINPDQDGDYNLQTRYQFHLKHDWSSYLATQLKALYQEDDYTGALQASAPRDSERYSLSAGIDYQLKRWILMQANWQYQDKTSDRSGYSFQQNVWTLSTQLSL